MNHSLSHDPEKRLPRSAIAALLMGRTDEQLAYLASEDHNAFAELYRRHVTNVYRYLLVRIGTANDAEDLTTQTFLAALQHISSYQGVGKFRSWLMGIARRKAADYFRQHRATLPLSVAKNIPHPDAPLEEFVDRQLRLELVAAMLQNLTPERAEALALRLFSQLTVSEIAHVMGKTEAAVKMLIHRAMCDLQQQLIAIQKEN